MAEIMEPIEGFMCGAPLVVRRTVEAFPEDQTVQRAVLTVRPWDGASDVILEKAITTTESEHGVIVQDGSEAPGEAVLDFKFTGAETAKLAGAYRYSIAVELSGQAEGDAPYRLASGWVKGQR